MFPPKLKAEDFLMAKNKKEIQQKADAKRVGRTRNFATIVYASKEYLDRIGSAYDGSDGYGTPPENWMEIISDFHVPVLISPLHGNCKNPDGKIKKPHWHVLFMFDTVKDWEKQVKPIFESFGGVGREKVNSCRGYARYLCHLDNAEKTQYNPNDIVFYGGADYHEVIGLPSDKYVIIDEMMDFCDKYNVVSLYLLMNYARKHREDWKRVLINSGAYIMREWLTSRKWSIDNNCGIIIDTETGEVLK